MSDYRKKFGVAPGEKVRLKNRNPNEHGKHESDEQAMPELEELVQQLIKLQALMYAENKSSLLIVLQGLDTAGKDGVIKHLCTGMNPQGCMVVGFKQPTHLEKEYDFLWRVHSHVPRKGNITLFNRSHYEDVLVAKVRKLAPKDVIAGRYERIKQFENLIAEENNTITLKFFLHISKEEQLARFKARIEDPARQWKISETDYSDRQHWDDYTEAFELLLRKTSTKSAPWFVIPANHKWFRNLAISRIVVDTLKDLKMKPPEPTVDIKKIKKLFEKEEAKTQRTKRGRSTA